MGFFVRNELHIYSVIISDNFSLECPVPVDKHACQHFPHPPDPLGKVKYLNFQ